MAESVLERAAIAAWRAHAAHELGEPVPDSWDGVAAPKEFYRETARAVLAAIREPDPGMLVAGQMAQAASILESHVEGVSVDILHKFAAVEPGHLREAYHAMLDAITKGG